MNKEKQISIFIVEDNKVFALALKADIETSFANMSVMIHIFETGETCMEKFKEEKPQVVILDYHLNSKNPVAADGIKVLDWIKKENYETNVIMLTTNDRIDIASKSFSHGAYDYVVKSETQFKKINYSLLNLFKMMKAKSDVRKYKHYSVFFICLIVLCIGVPIAIQIIYPTSYIRF